MKKNKQIESNKIKSGRIWFLQKIVYHTFLFQQIDKFLSDDASILAKTELSTLKKLLSVFVFFQ